MCIIISLIVLMSTWIYFSQKMQKIRLILIALIKDRQLTHTVQWSHIRVCTSGNISKHVRWGGSGFHYHNASSKRVRALKLGNNPFTNYSQHYAAAEFLKIPQTPGVYNNYDSRFWPGKGKFMISSFSSVFTTFIFSEYHTQVLLVHETHNLWQ